LRNIKSQAANIKQITISKYETSLFGKKGLLYFLWIVEHLGATYGADNLFPTGPVPVETGFENYGHRQRFYPF
jgi:hypothetical protein